MDDRTAKELLGTVRKLEAQEKEAFDWKNPFQSWRVPKILGGQSDWSPDGTPQNAYTPQRIHQLKEMVPGQLSKNRQSDIIQALLLAGGGAAALRGGLGLSRMFSESTKPVPARTIDMRIPVRDDEEDEKQAAGDDSFADRVGNLIPGMGSKDNPEATTESGAGYYLPAMLLGTPLAAYAGWKGVDALFNSQRKAKTKSRLEKAKRDYEEKLRDSYKTASDNSSPVDCLDVAFDKLAKPWFPNFPGQVKGLAATYALLSAPAAYMFVNDRMKKSSKRALLAKAMKERARRRAMSQPAELYAIPDTEEDETIGEDN